MEIIQILKADMFGLMLYTEWRDEQLARAIQDHLEDAEMERLCTREWPWDAVIEK